MAQYPGIGAPADFSTEMLSESHRENFRQMLRSLRLTAGLNTLAGPQSTWNTASRNAQTTLINRDQTGLESEAKSFEPTAYGATLGLIYYRAIGPVARLKWDAAIRNEIQTGLIAHGDALKLQEDISMSMIMNKNVLKHPGWLRARQDNAQTIQNYARYCDFLETLSNKKDMVFPSNDDATLNRPQVLGQNPWCLGTIPEWVSAYKQVKGSPGTSSPSFYQDGPRETETLEQNAAKMFGKAVEAKTVEYLGKFIEKGSEALLHGSLRVGMSFVSKLPVVDLLVDWLKNVRDQNTLRNLQRLYDDDMERRMMLFHKSWAVDPRPELDEVRPEEGAAMTAQQ